ncbi:MAG TPA: response regulator [Candidatus Methylacidiphilales bacterium]|nr:response regulator [Candidatus Methylacidiphilales bacterium]
MTQKNHCILLAEDDENDVIFLKRAFVKAEVNDALHLAPDGQIAIDYLSGAGQFADRNTFPFPSLLLLDLKMPRKSGMDVLRWIRAQPTCQILPVIVFSSSVAPQEVSAAYEAGANAFVTKPAGIPERTELVRLIKGFWLTFTQLPYPAPMRAT